jgi:hypothetical protein
MNAAHACRAERVQDYPAQRQKWQPRIRFDDGDVFGARRPHAAEGAEHGRGCGRGLVAELARGVRGFGGHG